ncbi:bactofilin family protein [Spirochaeta africana]|uniref:Integral membrane protein CcmA involved in cell shape determination n=1 Tax=Spirochaeta africana (strain ATCC 700263 / DSM 8902 / Z-7692) TaxID=889378 RepID=H9UL44_SPIAZ|nr:polymer-forming cytoskeletal protein [Spirochaeta africana]AFG38237.1 Integral membrane protein CcmA involved in cell shape determination [Spirochaeta africana DSM 8902]
MSDLRVRNIDEDEIDTVLGEDVEFQGDISFDNLVLIKGQVNGQLHSTSDVFISPTARVHAELDAQVISVKGSVQGDIRALRRLELFSTSSISGSIQTPDMIMQSGARFNGSCRMDVDSDMDIRSKGE